MTILVRIIGYVLVLISYISGYAENLSVKPSSEVVAIRFFDEKNGVLMQAGRCNCILKTNDGGRSWAAVPGPAGPALMYFLSPQIGWLLIQQDVSMPLVLYSTADGGDNWIKQGGFGAGSNPSDFLFLDSNTGLFIVHNTQSHASILLRTKDGGRTFDSVSLGAARSSYQLHSIIADRRQLWIAGDGVVLRSFDEGRSWDQVLPPGDHYSYPELHLIYKQREKLIFVGPSGVYQYEEASSQWVRLAALADKIRGIWGIAGLGKQMCIVGSATDLFCSPDGRSWLSRAKLPLASKSRPVRATIGNLFTSLVASSDDNAWIIDESGRLFQSADAGRTWHEKRIPYACANTSR